MGVEVNAGTLEAGAPLHFTGLDSDGQSLTVRGGSVLANADLSFDDGLGIAGGMVDVAAGATLEAGTASAPVTGTLSDAGDLRLAGNLRVHGDFVMTGGTLETTGSPDGHIALDPGFTFSQTGGTVVVIPVDTRAGEVMPFYVSASQPTPSPSSIAPADSDLFFASDGAVPTHSMDVSGQAGMPLSFAPVVLPSGGFTSNDLPTDWTGAGMPGEAPVIS
jgi:hypothetical protein